MGIATATATLAPARSRRAPAPFTTVYRSPDGGLHHARCNRCLQYRGSRGGVEVDFYCATCCEHVTIPEIAVARIPVVAFGGLS